MLVLLKMLAVSTVVNGNTQIYMYIYTQKPTHLPYHYLGNSQRNWPIVGECDRERIFCKTVTHHSSPLFPEYVYLIIYIYIYIHLILYCMLFTRFEGAETQFQLLSICLLFACCNRRPSDFPQRFPAPITHQASSEDL